MIPFFESADAILYHGDARELLPGLLPPVDAVITDPPYGIAKGAAFVRDGGALVADCGEDSFNALVLEADWVAAAAGLLPDGGYLATFCNTRRLRETEQALWNAGLEVWQRFYLINPAPPPTPRQTFMSGVQECVIAFRGKRRWFGGGSTPNFHIALPATRNEVSNHPAEKPLEAMAQLIRALVPPGGLVLDPFAGSGTTLKAAQLGGYRSIGIEIEEARCESIARRLTEARRSNAMQGGLFA